MASSLFLRMMTDDFNVHRSGPDHRLGFLQDYSGGQSMSFILIVVVAVVFAFVKEQSENR
jgi:hypothetical protein